MYTHETMIVGDSYTLYVEIDCDYHPFEFPSIAGGIHSWYR